MTLSVLRVTADVFALREAAAAAKASTAMPVCMAMARCCVCILPERTSLCDMLYMYTC